MGVADLDMLGGLEELDLAQVDTTRRMSRGEIGNDKLAMYQMAFEAYDTDRSGTISVDELESALAAAGHCSVSREQIETALHAIDDDNSGELDMDEFLQLMHILESVQTNPD